MSRRSKRPSKKPARERSPAAPSSPQDARETPPPVAVRAPVVTSAPRDTPLPGVDRISITSAAPRDTIQVRESWIEPVPAPGPPPLEGAAADRDTLQVRPSWIEVVDDGHTSAAEPLPPRASTDSLEPVSTAEKIAKAKSRTTSKRSPAKKASRNMRPSLDPSWEIPGPQSEPGRRALPPPLPATDASPSAAPPTSRRKKTR